MLLRRKEERRGGLSPTRADDRIQYEPDDYGDRERKRKVRVLYSAARRLHRRERALPRIPQEFGISTYKADSANVVDVTPDG